jgi:hypothetical protein
VGKQNSIPERNMAKKSSLLTLVTFLSFLSLLLTACHSQQPSVANAPPSNSAATSKPTPSAATVKFDEKVVIKETQEVAKGISEALSSGNKAALLDRLDRKTLAELGDDLNLQVPQAKQLAAAIASAKVVRALPDMVVYESAVGTETFSFYFIKEEGSWKFVGF